MKSGRPYRSGTWGAPRAEAQCFGHQHIVCARATGAQWQCPYLNLGGDFGGLSQHEPHSLVAGATGSGKSVLIQSLLLDIAATNPSHLAKIVLIDPKMGVDYAALEALPHLREPIITTQARAIEVLKALCRGDGPAIPAVCGGTLGTRRPSTRRLPRSAPPMIVLVHDEFADWMLDDNYKGGERRSRPPGVKARAAGIHLVLLLRSDPTRMSCPCNCARTWQPLDSQGCKRSNVENSTKPSNT